MSGGACVLNTWMHERRMGRVGQRRKCKKQAPVNTPLKKKRTTLNEMELVLTQTRERREGRRDQKNGLSGPRMN
jgi:hypothetical protein